MQLSDGYADLPSGKLANLVTFLEMLESPAGRAAQNVPDASIERIPLPDTARYRALFRRVGEPHLWFSRLTISDKQLAQIIRDPNVELYVLRYGGKDEGVIELDFRVAGECELAFFGVSAALVGKGFGRTLMDHALQAAWSRPITRFWLHTCTFDHAAAVPFYLRSGFRPFKRQIEICDDPRITGLLSRSAAPHIPLI